MRHSGSQLITIRGDRLKTNQACRCYLGLLLFLAAFYLLSYEAVPHSLDQVKGRIDCHQTNPLETKEEFCTSFKLDQPHPVWTSYFMNITEYNQFLLVKAKPLKRPLLGSKKVEKIDLTYELAVAHIEESGHVYAKAWPTKTHTVQITCDSLNNSEDDLEHICSGFTLFMEPELLTGNYLLEMRILNTDDIKHLIEGLHFEAYKINERYTSFLISVRYMAIFISLIFGVCFCINISSCPYHLRVFEQKYTAALSIGLILFNDPFAGINLIHPSRFSLFISIFCTITFLSMILLFWLVQFERVYKENATRPSKALKGWKICLVITFWFLSLLSASAIAYEYEEDPSFHIDEEFPGIAKLAGGVISLLFLIIIIYIGFCVYKSIQCWKTRIQRHKIFIGFSIFFVLAMSGDIASGTYDPYNLNGEEIISGIVITNLYVLVLMFIYSVNSQGRTEIKMPDRSKELEEDHKRNYLYLDDIAQRQQEDEEIQRKEQSQGQQGQGNRGTAFDVLGEKEEIDLEFDE